MPKGRVLWAFGAQTDKARAKEIVGQGACMSGNVPAALIHAGTPDEIVEHCRNLIEIAGKGGGYLFSTASGINRGTSAENVWAMINCVKELRRLRLIEVYPGGGGTIPSPSGRGLG